MTDVQKPFADTPATEPAAIQPIDTTGPGPVDVTKSAAPVSASTPATDAITQDPKPVDSTIQPGAAKPMEATVTSEAKKAVEPVYHGALGYKEPGSMK